MRRYAPLIRADANLVVPDTRRLDQGAHGIGERAPGVSSVVESKHGRIGRHLGAREQDGRL
jgi:hypothetical protein